uniref:Uncharacterized protein n=1 Tax=Tetranychus urticae TaxID=32264 RepID=T1KSM9_TETUR
MSDKSFCSDCSAESEFIFVELFATLKP